jgi:TatD DNase family protein
MPSDAHAHPKDLLALDPDAELERRGLGISCAASAWNEEEFLFQERLALDSSSAGAPPIALCFGAHPQLLRGDAAAALAAVSFLGRLAAERRIAAVGEIGFDFFDAAYRETAEAQDAVFVRQLAVAREFRLPCVLHLRRAMHKAFEHSAELAALPAVVFHSYSGTAAEAESLVKRGINAYFSFGTPVFLNHKRAMEACASVASDRLLTETDAPYQPPRGKSRSSWSDLSAVISAVAALRSAAGADCAEAAAVALAGDVNFKRAYGLAGIT